MHPHRRFRRTRHVVPALLIAVIALAAWSQGAADAARRPAGATTQVVVPRGHPVQIAFVGSSDFPAFTDSFRNAIEMAIEDHPLVRGYPIEVNESDPVCFSGADPGAANANAAAQIVRNTQNLGVLGHVCSGGERSALPVYARAGLVTISGSATAGDLPALGATVFNRTAVSDPDGGDAWYATVRTLLSDQAFVEDYEAEFDATPTFFADLYYDAASLLLRRIRQVSRIDSGGNLTIDRARLARVVRNTHWFAGVSCTVGLDASGSRVNDPAQLARCTNG